LSAIVEAGQFLLIDKPISTLPLESPHHRKTLLSIYR